MRGPARRVLVLAAFVAVEVGLRALPLPVLCRLVGVRTDGPPPPTPPVALPWWVGDRVAAARRLARRWPFEGRCLREALVVGILLRRWSPALRIGVARADGGPLQAHAWIEVAGATYDPLANAFARLDTIA